MIQSMTGFGRGSAQVGYITATVEMRSVNNRYLEIAVRLPRNLAEYETEIQSTAKSAFDRGRISIQVQVDAVSDEILPIQVDVKAARAYAQLLNTLREVAGVKDAIRLEHLLNYPDLFTTAEETETVLQQMWQAVQEALAQGIEDLQSMRRQEGSALKRDLEDRIDTLEHFLLQIEERAPLRVQEARDKLQKRLQEIFENDRIDKERLEFEIAILADKLDITEECVRLHSHLQLFRNALNNDVAEGRKLNFITQEINREINTIGSKANDTETLHLSVQMKDELEKIREQIQNVE